MEEDSSRPSGVVSFAPKGHEKTCIVGLLVLERPNTMQLSRDSTARDVPEYRFWNKETPYSFLRLILGTKMSFLGGFQVP